jgi:DNA-binding NarL/FixJ family response regulator
MDFVTGGGESAVDARSLATMAANRSAPTSMLTLIDGRTLERECFIRTMELVNPTLTVVGYSSLDEWRSAWDAEHAGVILYSIGGREVSNEAVASELRQLVGEAKPTPVVVLAESEDLHQMIAAVVDCGARGYIPASVGVDALVQVARLTSAGGVFLPATTIVGLRASIGSKNAEGGRMEERFTSRQAAVAEALRRGKANKIIAYELNMCESTVKVHIRNIMKRLNATNRTEAAFKLNSIAPGEEK